MTSTSMARQRRRTRPQSRTGMPLRILSAPRIFVFGDCRWASPSYCPSMDIRQLQYLAALAREKHFTRAAQACNVTQPTLSGRIRQLEMELGVPIVERGQRYQGLTQEGARVLKWAQLILNNWASMHQELAHLATSDFGLTGRLAVGAIPSALPMIPYLTQAVRKLHPHIDFTVMSLSSEEILRGLDDY